VYLTRFVNATQALGVHLAAVTHHEYIAATAANVLNASWLDASAENAAAVVAAVVRATAGRVPVIAGAGSNNTAEGTMGTRAGPTCRPRACASSHCITPVAASRPKALPPVSSTVLPFTSISLPPFRALPVT
jgi:hypothetical protein